MGEEIEMARNNQTIDRIQAVWNKLGGECGVDRLLRGELMLSEVSSPRHEEDIIHLEVTSDDTSGADWIKRLEDDGYCVSQRAKRILLSPEFKPTNGITIKVAIMSGWCFSSSQRTTGNICAEASRMKYVTPSLEIACLLRVMFTNINSEKLGRWGIVIMHEPSMESDGPDFLWVNNLGECRNLTVARANSDALWSIESLFAFAEVRVGGSRLFKKNSPRVL